ncbi:MAG: hypothetical protein FWB90_00300 [Fibromonadales bacterium]|nr:hypothetical protein [Fibromonadales bacterium]
MKILAVIPARKGSKGIPRKNMRFLHGKPLIWYALQNAITCSAITDIAVTSDDNEVLTYVSQFDVDAVERSSQLSNDDVTLDPVVYDAVIRMEREKKCVFDYVVTLQATSPMLKRESLMSAIEQIKKQNLDTLISVEDNTHLSWRADSCGYVPNYTERLNRQLLPKEYKETGAFLISRRECVKENGRIGKNVSIFPLSESETTDIDNSNDWNLCEAILKRRKIAFRADGSRELGLGHIYHTLTLAYRLTGHDVTFITRSDYSEGLEKLRTSNFPLVIIEREEEFIDYMKVNKPDITVVDCLNTDKNYMLNIKQFTKRLISIEDLGDGALCADATINALYEGVADNRSNCYFGYQYACLREEFQLALPKAFSDEVKRVFVMFGGSDPNNYTKEIYDFAIKFHNEMPQIRFDFIAGLAYDVEKYGIVAVEDCNIHVYNNIDIVSKYMKDADLAIIGQGRSIYETASLGIPTIVIAQNTRERMHTFASLGKGFINLGLGENIAGDTLEKTVKWLITTPQIRHEMRESMLAVELKSGVDRVIKIILGE